MKEIPLTQGKVALVDDEDYKMLMQYKWYAKKHRNTFYAVRNSNNEKNTQHYMHHYILGIKTNSGYITDHIDGNGCNNQKNNLRIVTNRQNMQNMHVKTSSKFPGVSWDKNRSLWESYITIDDRKRHLGRFKSGKDAAQAYINACQHLLT